MESESSTDMKCSFCTKVCKSATICQKCHSVRYCSKICRIHHLSSHEITCNAIVELEAIENSQKQKYSVRESGSSITQNRLIRLIGEKPLLVCSLNGVKCSLGHWVNG